MAKIIKETTGYLTAGKRNSDILEYETYLNRPGLIIVGESEHKFPGKKFVGIFFNSNFTIDYFHTSCGEIEENDNKLIFTSDHSRYEFTIDENCLDKDTIAEISINLLDYQGTRN